MDKDTRQCPQTTTFWRERRAEAVSNRGPSAYQPNALPLGQTGSLSRAGLRLVPQVRTALQLTGRKKLGPVAGTKPLN